MRIVILKSRQPFKANIPGQPPRSAWQRTLNNHGWRSDDLYRLAIELDNDIVEIEFDHMSDIDLSAKEVFAHE